MRCYHGIAVNCLIMLNRRRSNGWCEYSHNKLKNYILYVFSGFVCLSVAAVNLAAACILLTLLLNNVEEVLKV